ncbi:MAG: DUF2239 family protein [Methyloceanibacter sp.]
MTGESCTAFQGAKRIASGALVEVAAKVKAIVDRGDPSMILIFDDVTAEPVEVDFRGAVEDVIARLTERSESLPAGPSMQRGPGRPKLGVVAREVTLLPRHWEWLARQPGGASVALRKLVDQARRAYGEKDRRREAQATAYRFMSALAGNERGFEEAARALFAGHRARFGEVTAAWPHDIRDHTMKLAAAAFAEQPTEAASHPRR